MGILKVFQSQFISVGIFDFNAILTFTIKYLHVCLLQRAGADSCLSS